MVNKKNKVYINGKTSKYFKVNENLSLLYNEIPRSEKGKMPHLCTRHEPWQQKPIIGGISWKESFPSRQNCHS